jgi:hypothetical protein
MDGLVRVVWAAVYAYLCSPLKESLFVKQLPLSLKYLDG